MMGDDDVAAAAAAAKLAAQKIAAQLGQDSGSGPGPEETKEQRRARKRKSRWGGADDTDKTFIPGLPTMIPSGLTPDQEEAYLRKFSLSHLIVTYLTNDICKLNEASKKSKFCSFLYIFKYYLLML